MKNRLPSKMLSPFVFLVSILAITALACSAGGITLGKDSATVEVKLTESQLNEIFSRTDVQPGSGSDRLLDKITSVELHDGFIRVFGEGTDSDGNKIVGSYDVSLGAENDELKVQIVAVDVAGITLDDPRVVKVNQELSQELAKSVTESNGDVKFKEAEVTTDGLKLKVQVQFK